MKRERFSLCLLVVLALFICNPAAAAEFPTKPINVWFGFQAGGGMDLTGRALAAEVSKTLKQPLICSNFVGGAGTLVLGKLKGESPDGYTIANATTGSFCRSPHMHSVPFDPFKDFTPIMQYGIFQYGIVVRADAPWKTFEEFIDYAKKNPGKIKYSSAGIGLGQHLAMEYIGMKEGIQWTHIPFTGSPQAISALLGGHVEAMSQTADWTEYVRSGKLRLLLVLSSQRMKSFPDIPTMLEKGYEFAPHGGICFVGPAGMPKPVVEKLQNAFRDAMNSKDYINISEKMELGIEYKDSETLAKFIPKDYKETGDLLKKLGLGIYKKK